MFSLYTYCMCMCVYIFSWIWGQIKTSWSKELQVEKIKALNLGRDKAQTHPGLELWEIWDADHNHGGATSSRMRNAVPWWWL